VSEGLARVPVFPLRSVVFPNALVALHIFEDRYRLMINDCLDEGTPFGTALIRKGREVGDKYVEPYLVGTLLTIREVERLDDVRMNIVAQGGERFRIRELDYESEPYLVGRAEPVTDQAWTGSDEEMGLLEAAKDAFAELADALTERLDFTVQIRLTEDPTSLSFAMAGLLRMGRREAQHMLELTSAAERFQEMLPVMHRLISYVRSGQLRSGGYEHIRHWISPN